MRQQLPVYSPLSPAAIAAAFRSLASGHEAVRAARDALTERYHSRSLLLTDSGTSALALGLEHAARARNDAPVALPAYCCYDIATAAVGARVRVYLYDVDPLTLSPDLASLAAVLERGARVVAVAHLYGVPVDLNRVGALCARYEALLLEDAAQGAGGSLDGRLLGTVGSTAVLSFGRGKGTTGGGGGALLANDSDGDRMVEGAGNRLLPGKGLSVVVGLVAQWLLGSPRWYGLPARMPLLKLGETIYHPPWAAGRIAAASAGALSVTLPLADAEVVTRRQHSARLRKAMVGSRARPIELVAGADPGYLRLPVLVAEENRGRFSGPGPRRYGVMPGYPMSIRRLDSFRPYLLNALEAFPGADRLVHELFTLPTHGLLSESDLTWLEELLRS